MEYNIIGPTNNNIECQAYEFSWLGYCTLRKNSMITTTQCVGRADTRRRLPRRRRQCTHLTVIASLLPLALFSSSPLPPLLLRTEAFSSTPTPSAKGTSSWRTLLGTSFNSCSRSVESSLAIPSSTTALLLASQTGRLTESPPLKGATENNNSSGGGAVRTSYGPPIAMTDNVTVSKKKQKYNNNDINNGKNNGNTAGKKKKQKDRHASSRPYSNLSMEELKMLTDYHLSGIHNGVSFIIQDGDAAAAANDAKDAAANQSSMTQNINHYKHENIDNKTGTMSPAQMHELSRLLASWSKLELNSQLQQVLSRREKSLAADMAETCLSKLLEEKEAGNGKVMITADMYHNVIKAYLKTGLHNDLIHATSLLDLMEETHSGDTEFLQSSTKCYVSILDGWCKSRSIGAEIKAEEMLHRIDSTFSSYSSSSSSSSSSSNGTVNGDKKGRGKKVGGGIGGGGIDVRYYNNVMNRIATSNKPNAGQEAERLLHHLISLYQKYGYANMAPNKSSFNTVIKAYANTGGKASARNAKRILNMMENPRLITASDGAANGGTDGGDNSTNESNNILENIEPDKISCNSILLAWANSRESDGGEKAEQLLERMEAVYRRGGNSGIKPDTVTYNAVIKVWGKCGDKYAGERSESLLNKMIRRYEAGDVDVCPDDVSFNSVIHNLANGKEVDSPRRAMRLLERMERSYNSGIIEAKPDIISYNSVLNAFAQSGRVGSAQHAEKILDNLEQSFDSGDGDIQPDVYSYNIVINAWANSGDANRAVALLDRMTARSKKGQANLKPDVKTYNSVLHAWSQSLDRNAPVKALGLLELMFRLYDGGDGGAQPDVLSFSTVINAFSKSKFPGKAREVKNLLNRMKQLHEDGQEGMEPNIYVYAAVLNACAYTFGAKDEKEEALKIGIEIYEELQEKGLANHVAYGSFLRICRKLIIDDDARRDELISRAFRHCCVDGQVGEYVLTQLRAISKLYVALLEAYIIDGEVSYNDLPSKWTRNVRDRKRRTQVRRRYHYNK